MTTEKRVAIMYDGDVTPSLNENPGQPVLWRDTSGPAAVLKIHNNDDTAWLAIEADEAAAAVLNALDEAATELTALDADLDESVTEADFEDSSGDLDLGAIAEAVSATNARVNEIATAVNALITALKATAVS